MNRLLVAASNTAIIISGLAGCAVSSGKVPPHPASHAASVSAPKKSMRAFRSEQELASYLREIAEKQKVERRAMYDGYGGPVAAKSAAVAVPGARLQSQSST